ncbi:MAG: type II toxin-antitoxin system RelE/ParE family toxin [Clostridia bacterium]|nr:type II toxin-antitoxin system RelE/ParE family toxin [Clostridia bacterium]
MEIKYKNKKTQKQCTNLDYAKKEFNQNIATLLFSRINFIENAESFADIVNHPSFHFHGLSGKLQGFYAIDLGRKLGFRLIIEPLNEKEESLKEEKDIEIIKQCTKIVIVVEVSNHYE